MSRPHLYLARHGVTQANLDGVRAGLTDIPLLEEGRREAHKLADRVAALEIVEVWTSPIARARETAATVAERCAIPLFVDPDLRELDPGPWEGLSDDQLRERFPDQFARWQTDPASFHIDGRETLAAVMRRTVAAVERILARRVDALVVSHSEPIRLLRVHYAHLDLNEFAAFEPGHAQLLELLPADGGYSLVPLD